MRNREEEVVNRRARHRKDCLVGDGEVGAEVARVTEDCTGWVSTSEERLKTAGTHER